MTADPIANYISNLNNAAKAGKESVVFPYSNLKNAISDLLERDGYVKNITKKGKKGTKTVEVKIVYGEHGKPRIQGAERVSRPSKRIYRNAEQLVPVKNGFGELVISTSKGVMNDKTARKEKVGGEVLFKIW
jgi:small subunit ribosomal protein S8